MELSKIEKAEDLLTLYSEVVYDIENLSRGGELYIKMLMPIPNEKDGYHNITSDLITTEHLKEILINEKIRLENEIKEL